MIKRKKIAAVFAALVIASLSLTACSSSDKTTESSSAQTSSSESTSQAGQSDSASETASADTSAESYFAEGDYRDVESGEANAVITLSGDTGTISDTTRGTSGSDVTITSKGIYEVTGSSENVSIIVNDESKSGNIYIILNDAAMTNSEAPCIIVENSEKVIVVCKGSNTLTYTCDNNADGLDGAIYSEDDLTINGSGSLTIDSSLHGIVCKDDLKVVGGVLNISSESIGIQAGDSVRIGGGEITLNAGHDGIQAANKSGDSFMVMTDGTLTIDAGYDGIDVGTTDADFTGSVTLSGGVVNITAGGGSDNSKDSDTSQKGIKCDGDIIVGDVQLDVSSADDSVHSDNSITVSGGTLKLSTSDDGITADNQLTIIGGSVTVEKSYEALEAADITISGGDISVVSSDDGINAGGGSDTNSTELGPQGGSSSGTITISGGNVYVDASGDGIDSNGSIYITGGTVIVEGPTDNGNGALDKGDSADCVASITGGTVIALGSSGMAVNFDSGTQCSALVSLSGLEGAELSIDDGSGFTFTASKSFECVVYSSPSLSEGKSYTITAGSQSAEFDFSSGLYYSNVSSMNGMKNNPGGRP